MASGDERMNGCKWCSCIARVRSPSNEEATNAPPDFGDSTFEQHYQLLLRMGVDEKKARQQTLKRQAEKRARQIANEGGGASSSRTNGCKWCSCIAIPRSPRQEATRENLSGYAPHDFDGIILDPHYRQYLRLGLSEKKAREEALKLKVFKDRIYEKREAEKKAREEAEKQAVEEPTIDLEEELKKMKKAREERYCNMVARAIQGLSKTKPSASKEPGGRKCSCCGADDLLLNTWSGCGHLICDDCMGYHLPQAMVRTLWEVKCKVEKCQFTMTAEECRVFLPGHEDLIDDWIENIPEAVRNPNPPPAVESRVENPPHDADEEAEFKRAMQLSLEPFSPGANQGEGASSSNAKPGGGPECVRCGSDEGRIHTWSRCGHLICDKCMVDHLEYMIEYKVWNVRCRVKGCPETMTAEECRVFLQDNQQDQINDWIAKIPEAVRNPNPPPAVDSRSVENMLDGWMDNMTENPPPGVDEEADVQRAIQLSLEDQMAGPRANEGEGASSSNTKPGRGPECGRCGVDEGRIHTWSRCRHLICDECMGDHLDYMIGHKVWNVRCRVKGCTETMTAEECRVFLPDNQQDRINDWIASIPEADRAS